MGKSSISNAPLFARKTFREDVVSGLTVALVGLPQCLAYAMMSGLPPAYGLVTAAVPGALAALAGRSAQVITGPTNTTGLVILAALGPWIGASGLLSEEGLPVLATLTVLAGLLRIVGSMVGAAELLRFLPLSVLVGFTAGAGILIGVMQLDEALGIPPVRSGSLLGEFTGLYDAMASGHFPQLPAVMMTVGTAAMLILGKKYAPRWPIALLTVLGSIAIVAIGSLDQSSGLPLVADRSPIPSGWPAGAMPTLDVSIIESLLAPSLAIVLLGTLELTVTAQAGAERPNMKRELAAQGVANLFGAFASAFPASASLTRSALLKLGGGKTRMAALSAALTVIPILLFGGSFVGLIPQSALAGVLFVTAYGMINVQRILRMFRAWRTTQVLMIVTLGATLTMPLQYAILIGAGLGLAIHLGRTSSPRFNLLAVEEGAFVPLEQATDVTTVVAEISGSLHYAATTSLSRDLHPKIPKETKRLVLDLSHAHELRYSGLRAMEVLRTELEAEGVQLELAGVSPDIEKVMGRAHCELPMTRWHAVPSQAVRNALAGKCEVVPDIPGTGSDAEADDDE